MNKITLIGRTTKEIDYNEKDGKQYANFTLAVRRNKEDADFINCVAFGSQAELLNKYVEKGNQVGVIGRLQIVNKQLDDGYKSYTQVIVSEIELLGKKQS